MIASGARTRARAMRSTLWKHAEILLRARVSPRSAGSEVNLRHLTGFLGKTTEGPCTSGARDVLPLSPRSQPGGPRQSWSSLAPRSAFSIKDAYRFCRLVNRILDREEPKRTREEWQRSEHSRSVDTLLSYVRSGGRNALDASARMEKSSEGAQRILGLLGQNRTLDGAVRVLIGIGAWKPHVSVSLGLLDRDGFDDDVVSLADDYMANPPEDLDRSTRLDLTHLRTVTIDDISTTEIDDGLSVETLGEGEGGSERKRIWIHIADPTRWLRMEDSVFREAQRRATSIYVPTGVIPMMPYDIATQTFSLVKGKVNSAFSLGVEVCMETGAIKDYVVTPSTVLVEERLTYLKTDELLHSRTSEEEPDLFYLARAARARWHYRKANGAQTFASYSPKIKVRPSQRGDDADGGGGEREAGSNGVDVIIERNDAQQQTVEYNQSGQTIVSEMMILAGEVGAKWGKDNNVPLPYRMHYKPVIPNESEISSIEDEFAKTANLAKVFTRAVLDCREPRPHASLGLPYYTQLSSPIRRFNDILVHLQIKSVLRGEGVLFSADALAEAAEAAYFVEREMKEVAQQCEEYWAAIYFVQRMDQVWEATFLSWKHLEGGMGFVQIDKVGVKHVVKIDRPAIPGEKLWIRATAAIPRLDGSSILIFEQASPSA